MTFDGPDKCPGNWSQASDSAPCGPGDKFNSRQLIPTEFSLKLQHLSTDLNPELQFN